MTFKPGELSARFVRLQGPSRKPIHIFEVGLDGKGLRQLTRGEWSDLDPAYPPNGDIAFASERCETSLQCNEYDKDETSWGWSRAPWSGSGPGRGATWRPSSGPSPGRSGGPGLRTPARPGRNPRDHEPAAH